MYAVEKYIVENVVEKSGLRIFVRSVCNVGKNGQ